MAMRRAALALALALAACSKGPGGSTAETPPAGTDAAGPDVAPSAIPGVALSYRYAYRLPIAEVAHAQEQHAAACEALGPLRCRITGLEYHAAENRQITGTLDVKLAPAIARAFGRQATAAVLADKGMLSDTEITSTEAGATIEGANRSAASMTAEQREIADQLGKPGLGSTERAQLQARLQALRDTQRTVAEDRAAAAATLASTPMHLDYRSGAVDPGYADGPVRGALRDGWLNVVAGVAVLLTLLITLLPWALAAGLLVWLWRRFGARLFPYRPVDRS